jgi:hypothetical protein
MQRHSSDCPGPLGHSDAAILREDSEQNRTGLQTPQEKDTGMLAKLTSPYVVGVIARMLGQVISFLGVAIASRFLDLQAFGTYALAWAATVIATTFVFTGFYQALLRSREYGRDRDSLFWLKLGVGSAGSLVIFVLGQAAGGCPARQALHYAPWRRSPLCNPPLPGGRRSWCAPSACAPPASMSWPPKLSALSRPS